MSQNSAFDELTSIADRYDRRSDIPADRYSMLNPSVWQAVQERERAILKLIRKRVAKPLGDVQLVEVGCGHGGNLLEMLSIGLAPQNLAGIELLPERAELARERLPTACRITTGDALAAGVAPKTLDIVLQSTVFSSILDENFQIELADAMWRWLRPGGAILWYDFVFNNPRNRDVAGVSRARVRALFPAGKFTCRRVTLAPPISRSVCQIHPALYGLLNALPILRTHLLCWIEKP